MISWKRYVDGDAGLWLFRSERLRHRDGRSITEALEADPWLDAASRYPEGRLVTGRVEKTAKFGAFIELEPGLTGLLPTSAMALPRGSNPGRTYAPGSLTFSFSSSTVYM